MATWKAEELVIVERYLEENPGIVTVNKCEEVQKILQQAGFDRGANAIKIKIGYIKRAKRAREQGIPTASSASEIWTEEEERRLVRKYAQAEGTNKIAKIRNIIIDFPKRSEKAIATKLRQDFPQIYYNRAGTSHEFLT